MSDSNRTNLKSKKALYKNGKPPWRHLLAFPISIILFVASFGLGIIADGKLFSNMDAETLGHAAPVFTIIIPMLFMFVLSIVCLVAIIRFFVELSRNKKWRDNINTVE